MFNLLARTADTGTVLFSTDVNLYYSVLGAAAAVTVFNSYWPDVIVGVSIAALFLKSAFSVLHESFGELLKLKSQSETIA